MKLTPSEKQTLSGPLVAGFILGTVVGLASLGFDSEYGHLTRWHMAFDALAAFLISVAIAVVPLGLLPIAIQRLRRSRASPTE